MVMLVLLFNVSFGVLTLHFSIIFLFIILVSILFLNDWDVNLAILLLIHLLFIIGFLSFRQRTDALLHSHQTRLPFLHWKTILFIMLQIVLKVYNIYYMWPNTWICMARAQWASTEETTHSTTHVQPHKMTIIILKYNVDKLMKTTKT